MKTVMENGLSSTGVGKRFRKTSELYFTAKGQHKDKQIIQLLNTFISITSLACLENLLI